MNLDQTVVMRVRHRFGDAALDPKESDVDFPAPFVGKVGTFPFSCHNVDRSKDAILQFQYRGAVQNVSFPAPVPGLVALGPEHPVKINGHELFGGVPMGSKFDTAPLWHTRLLIIEPGVLAEENVLQIEALEYPLVNPTPKTLDNFTIDNAVVTFKTNGGDGGTVSRADRLARE